MKQFLQDGYTKIRPSMLRKDIALSFVSYFLMPEQRRVFAIIATGTSEIIFMDPVFIS